MSRIIRVKDHYADILLDDGKHVLLSFTPDEVAVFQLFFGLPIKKLWKMARVSFEVTSKRNGRSAMGAAVNTLSQAKDVEEVFKMMNSIVSK